MSGLQDVRPKNLKIKLGNKERTLRYDLNAYAELEDAYGSIDAAMDAVGKGKLKALRKVIWAGLIHEDETLTERAVGSWITMEDLQEFTKAIEGAITGSLPEVKPVDTPVQVPCVPADDCNVDPK